MSSIEEAARAAISVIIAKKAELEDRKSQLEKLLLDDNQYKFAVENIKDANKAKKDAMTRLLKKREIAVLDSEVKELRGTLTEKQNALFDYLLQYTEESGHLEIEDNTGVKRSITKSAKIKI